MSLSEVSRQICCNYNSPEERERDKKRTKSKQAISTSHLLEKITDIHRHDASVWLLFKVLLDYAACRRFTFWCFFVPSARRNNAGVCSGLSSPVIPRLQQQHQSINCRTVTVAMSWNTCIVIQFTGMVCEGWSHWVRSRQNYENHANSSPADAKQLALCSAHCLIPAPKTHHKVHLLSNICVSVEGVYVFKKKERKTGDTASVWCHFVLFAP